MALSMRLVGIAVTTSHFQAGSVPLQHPAKVKAASGIDYYKMIPFKYYKKRATPELKSAEFEPFLLPEYVCKQKMSGVKLEIRGWLLPQPPFSSFLCWLTQTANITGDDEKASIMPL